MIHLFNRKQLFLDSSAEEAARVWSTLRQHNIPYTMKTAGVGTSLRRGLDAKIASGPMNGAVRYSEATDPCRYVYAIYVHRRDYQRAKELIG